MISLARGASLMRTSMPSKWLRTNAASLCPSGMSRTTPSPPRFFEDGIRRRALAEHAPYRRAQFGMKDGGGMLQFAILADRRGLTVTFGGRSSDAERCDSTLRQQLAEFFADRHQLGKVFDIFARIRIFDHRDRRCAPGRRIDRSRPISVEISSTNVAIFRIFAFIADPSSPLISDAFNPPTRAWTRAPVVMTSASRISSARGASVMPTSIASKWLRTYEALMCVMGTSRRVPGPPTFLVEATIAFAPPRYFAHRITAGNMPERAVLEFSGRADDRSLAVPFNRPSDRRPVPLTSASAISRPKRLQVFHEACNLFDVTVPHTDCGLRRARPRGVAAWPRRGRLRGKSPRLRTTLLRIWTSGMNHSPIERWNRARTVSEPAALTTRVSPCKVRAAAHMSPRCRSDSATCDCQPARASRISCGSNVSDRSCDVAVRPDRCQARVHTPEHVDVGMSRQVHCIRHDGRCGVGHCCSISEHGDRVGNAQRKTAPAPSAGGNSADWTESKSMVVVPEQASGVSNDSPADLDTRSCPPQSFLPA